jgi:hypothetical protein
MVVEDSLPFAVPPDQPNIAESTIARGTNG